MKASSSEKIDFFNRLEERFLNLSSAEKKLFKDWIMCRKDSDENKCWQIIKEVDDSNLCEGDIQIKIETKLKIHLFLGLNIF